MTFVVVLALLAFGLLALVIGRATSRSTDRMRGGAADLRRADDGGTGEYVDYTSPMG